MGVEMVSRFPMPESLMRPRHVSAHSRGEKLYAVLERANLLMEYALDGETGAVVGNRSVYSLIPDSESHIPRKWGRANEAAELVKNYWSAEVKLSATEEYLWATARANSGTDLYGYISCFELDASGAIMKRLFMVPTTTTGGIANAVSPSPFSDEWVALTDVPKGYVQMWKMDAAAATAVAVANVTIGDGGCCANVIWYD